MKNQQHDNNASVPFNGRRPMEEADDTSMRHSSSLEPPQRQNKKKKYQKHSSSATAKPKSPQKDSSSYNSFDKKCQDYEIEVFPDTTSRKNMIPTTSKNAADKNIIKKDINLAQPETYPDTTNTVTAKACADAGSALSAKLNEKSKTAHRQRQGKHNHAQQQPSIFPEVSPAAVTGTNTQEHKEKTKNNNIPEEEGTYEEEEDLINHDSANVVEDSRQYPGAIMCGNTSTDHRSPSLCYDDENLSTSIINNYPNNTVNVTTRSHQGRHNEESQGEPETTITAEPMPTTTQPNIPMIPTSPQPTFPPLTRTTWIQVGNDIDGLNTGDRAGNSVSMSELGDIVVVGAPAWSEGRPGSSQVYKLDSSTNKWNLIDTSLAGTSTSNEADGFGTAVSTSNDCTVIAIGAPYTNSNTGSVYIYYLNKATNTIEFIQEITGDNINDYFGASVDVSGDGSTIIVGTGWEGDNEYVKVYYKDDNSNSNDNKWSQLGNTIVGSSSNGDGFGDSVSISTDGNIVAVGASQTYNEDDLPGYVKIYQYDKSSKTWIDYGNNNDNVLVGDNYYDWFGDSISLSSNGNIVAIGAPNNDGINNDKPLCGSVKIFQLNSNTNNWEQLGSNIDGENERDYSGSDEGIKLSDNGMIVAIGSGWNDGINGYSSGSVRIFEYDLNNNKWKQISQDIDGESKDDWSGYSISLSGDGSIVAIGARGNDGINGDNSGHVRVYRRGDA